MISEKEDEKLKKHERRNHIQPLIHKWFKSPFSFSARSRKIKDCDCDINNFQVNHIFSSVVEWKCNLFKILNKVKPLRRIT